MTIESLRGASYPQNRAKEIAGGVLGFVTIAKRKVVEKIVPKALKATKDVATLVAGAKAGGVIAELLTRAQTHGRQGLETQRSSHHASQVWALVTKTRAGV